MIFDTYKEKEKRNIGEKAKSLLSPPLLSACVIVPGVAAAACVSCFIPSVANAFFNCFVFIFYFHF